MQRNVNVNFIKVVTIEQMIDSVIQIAPKGPTVPIFFISFEVKVAWQLYHLSTPKHQVVLILRRIFLIQVIKVPDP